MHQQPIVHQMPLYEYQCDACGHRFEQIQKFSDPLVADCPECGGAVRKLLSSPAIQFKGTGWYATDYANKGTGGTAASEAAKAGDGKTEKPSKSDGPSGDSTSSSDSPKSASGSSKKTSGASSSSSRS